MELTKSQEAAALHGVATNVAYPLRDRLQAALQALEWYEAEVELLHQLRDTAMAWRDWRRKWITNYGLGWDEGLTRPVIRDLVHAVDALDRETNGASST